MGVTEFYRARTDTKMTIAAERLAVIAAITLPITSLSSVLGMNVIVNESTHWVALGILLLIMLIISLILLRWTRKQGWLGSAGRAGQEVGHQLDNEWGTFVCQPGPACGTTRRLPSGRDRARAALGPRLAISRSPTITSAGAAARTASGLMSTGRT